MIFLPFLGVFITLALLGRYYRIPEFIDTNASFQQRLAGVIHGTTLARALYELLVPSITCRSIYTNGEGKGKRARGDLPTANNTPRMEQTFRRF